MDFLSVATFLACTASPDREGAVLAEPKAIGATAATSVGINLSDPEDWTTQWPFANLAKNARAWSLKSGNPIDVDDHGYPTRVPSGDRAETYIGWDRGWFLPEGVYVMEWDGNADVTIDEDPGYLDVISQAPGRIEVEVNPDLEAQRPNGIHLELASFDASDGFSDFRLWMPGHEDRMQRWNDYILEVLAPFALLRTMDAQKTNHSKETTWADTAHVDDFTWADSGVPLEVLVELANESRSDLWVNIPHRADDAYVETFAGVLVEHLAPERQVWVEYSNEVWNSGFSQYDWVGDNYGTGDEAWVRAYTGYGVRAASVLDIVDDIVPANQLVRVAGSQSANDWVSEQLLEAAGEDPPFDVLAIAPYFSGDMSHAGTDGDYWAGQPVDAWLDEAARSIDDAMADVAAHRDEAEQYGLTVVGYEGGSHITPISGSSWSDAFVDKAIAVHHDPGMTELYVDYLSEWQAQTDGPMVLFHSVGMWTKWGSWGHLEYLEQEPADNPKMLGVYKTLYDFSGDRVIDNADIHAFVDGYLAREAWTDLNRDGILDQGDIASFTKGFQTASN